MAVLVVGGSLEQDRADALRDTAAELDLPVISGRP
jgi:hypothetical protein